MPSTHPRILPCPRRAEGLLRFVAARAEEGRCLPGSEASSVHAPLAGLRRRAKQV